MSPGDAGPPATPAVGGDREGGGAPVRPGSLEAAALAGDGSAWAALVERDNHKVVVALLARGVPLDHARELAQETWARLIARQQSGRLVELSLPGLAIVQAGFLAANDRRRPRTLPIEAAREPASPRTLEDDAIGKQRLVLLARALRDCPPSARRVFEQVYDHPELSYAEVATRVGLSVQRVKQIVFEVRKRLRAALEGEGT